MALIGEGLGSCLRAVLKCHGDGVSVHTSHEETEQASHSEELLEGAGIDGSDLEKTENNHVDDHGPFATKLISEGTEEGSAHRAEEKCECDGCGDGCVRSLVVGCELCCLDG